MMSSMLNEPANPFAGCGSVAELILAGSVALDDANALRDTLIAAGLERWCLMNAVKELRRGHPELAALVRAVADGLPRDPRPRGRNIQRWKR
jgi:hypothetical protein